MCRKFPTWVGVAAETRRLRSRCCQREGSRVGYSRSSIAAICLGLLLTVLGHDALMSADPHAGGSAGHIDLGGHHESPVPPDDIDCGPITGMHLKPSNTLDVDATAVAPSSPFGIEEHVSFSPHWSVAPGHPPDTRRALLQVYLN